MNKKVLILGGLAALWAFNNEDVASAASAAFDPLLLLNLISFLPDPKFKSKKAKAKAEKAKANKAKAEKAKAEKVKAEKVKAEKAKVGKGKVSGAAVEKAGAKVGEELGEKAGVKVGGEVAEKSGIKASQLAAEKAGIKAAEETAEKAGSTVAKEVAEKAGTSVAKEVAEKAGVSVAKDVAEKAGAAASKAGAVAAKELAEKAAVKAGETAAERVAKMLAARAARAAVTASKLATLAAKSAAQGPIGALDMLALGVIITLQNTVKDLDTEAYREPRPGMLSYSQLPEAVKIVFSFIPLIGTIGDFVFPFFEFGTGCPEGTTQEFPGSLCFSKCKDGYRALNGDIFCYKDYGPTWEDDKAHSDWPAIPTTLKKIIRTNTGVPVSECAPDQDKDAGLCYNKCPDGYHGVGPLCWQDTLNVGIGTPVELESCPDGYNTDALTCFKPLACSGGGCRTWCAGGRDAFGNCWAWDLRTECDPVTCNDGPKTIGRLDNGGNCPSDREKIDGLCYPRCPDGWEHVPGMPYNCRRIGSSTTTERGVGKPMGCPVGKTEDSAGLCYDAAPEGFKKSTLGLMETPCPPDSDDAGLLCTRHSYTRPGNVAFKFAIREHKGEDEEY